jgi:uncharacterized protein YciI
MYVVLLNYLKPIEEVERLTVPHRAFLDTLYEQDVLLVSGPQIPRTGGVLIARGGRGKDELLAILQQDPFYTEGIAEHTIIEFNPVKHHAVLKELL